MRVLHVVPRLAVGGLSTQLRQLCNASDTRLQHTVVSIFDGNESYITQEIECPIKFFDIRPSERHDIKAIAQKLTDYAAQVNASVLLSYHAFSDVYVASTSNASRLPAVRLVLGVTQTDWQTGHAITDASNWSPATLQLLRATHPAFLATCTASQHLHDELLEFGFAHSPIHTVHPGTFTPTVKHHKSANAFPMTSMDIAFPHRIEAVKGIDQLVPLVSQLASKGVAVRIHYPRCGAQLGGFEEEVRVSGLGENFVAFAPGESAWESSPETDCMILCSKSEGVPHTVLEAMARGLPVAAYAVGGLPEVITHNNDGLLCAPGAITALAEQIFRLATHPNLAQRLSEAAERKVQDKFSVQRYRDRMTSVLRGAVSSASA